MLFRRRVLLMSPLVVIAPVIRLRLCLAFALLPLSINLKSA